MDARNVDRLLEKIFSLADRATFVGARMAEGMAREVRLDPTVKADIAPLYREEALRRAALSASLGLALCRAVESDATDEPARARLAWYRGQFETIDADARRALATEFPTSRLELHER